MGSLNTDCCAWWRSNVIALCKKIFLFVAISMFNWMLLCHFLWMWWLDLRQLPAAHPVTASLPLLKKVGQEKQTKTRSWADKRPWRSFTTYYHNQTTRNIKKSNLMHCQLKLIRMRRQKKNPNKATSPSPTLTFSPCSTWLQHPQFLITISAISSRC